MSGALFTGWRPEAAERDALSRLVSGIEGIRPAGAPRPRLRRPDQWHVTLCFIGHDVADAVVAEARRALAEASTRVAPHAWRPERVDYWPGSGAVVALPEPDPALQALCDACASALDVAGIPVRATTEPHLTLAFLPRHLPPQAWLADVRCERATMRVDGFELLRNAGGRYEAVAAWPLARPSRRSLILVGRPCNGDADTGTCDAPEAVPSTCGLPGRCRLYRGSGARRQSRGRGRRTRRR